ncbi:MAG TPA: T9SS type A sorting domain-containing protein [Chitinophagales bacterium]|nr:T9SS type A sorting domain-containing protein [Chitinophagales bacterium]
MKKLYFSLCLCLVLSRSFSQTLQPLTVGEIYNYEVGDTFIHAQTMHDQYPITYTQTAIVSKTFSANADTIFYGVETKSQMAFWGPPPSCCQGVTQNSYTFSTTNLNDTITNRIWLGNPHGNIDTAVIQHDTLFSSNGIIYSQTDLNFYPSNCTATYTYGAGLGNTYSYWICPIDGYENELVYYHKKNGAMAGQPREFLTGVNEVADNVQVILSPNPVKESFQLQLSETPAPQTYLHVYDAMGSELRKEPVLSSQNTVSRHGLSAGIYFWQLEAQGKTLSHGKLTYE